MKETHTFRLNNIQYSDITMEEAISISRSRVEKYGTTVTLSVRGKSGKFIRLGTYYPGPRKEPWEKVSVQLSVPSIYEIQEPITSITAVPRADGALKVKALVLLFNKKPDPLNRVFIGSNITGSHTPGEDVNTWFENMKDNHLFPDVDHVSIRSHV